MDQLLPNRLLILVVVVWLTKSAASSSIIINEINLDWDKTPQSMEEKYQWIEIKTLPDEEIKPKNFVRSANAENAALDRHPRVSHSLSDHPLMRTRLIIYNGEDRTVHTIVDLDELTDNEYYIIGNTPNRQELAQKSPTTSWNSPRVRSVSNGRDRHGYLATFWGSESAAAIYRGPARIFVELSLSLHCLSADIKDMQAYLVDIAFYSLHTRPNPTMNECFGKPPYQRSFPSEPLFGRREVTWSRCPPSSINLPYQTDYWQITTPTPLEDNDCGPRTPGFPPDPAIIIGAVPGEDVVDLPSIHDPVSANGVCTKNDKKRQSINIQAKALREESRQNGAGVCINKRQNIELFQEYSGPDSELKTVKKARVSSDNCLSADVKQSMYSTTSAMRPNSIEWNNFFSLYNEHFTEKMFTKDDSNFQNTKRWFWLEGITTHGDKARCHICFTHWDAFRQAHPTTSMQTRSDLTKLEGKSYGSRKENEGRIERHSHNHDHENIVSWRGSTWNSEVKENARSTERRIYHEQTTETPGLERLFRTIYFGAKHNIAMTTIEDLVQLQIRNSAAFDNWEHKRDAIDRISRYIAIDMDEAMRRYILKNRPLCSVTIDGWRNTFGTEHLLVSMKFIARGVLQTWFIRSEPLIQENSGATFEALMNALTATLAYPHQQVPEMKTWLQESIVGFASDGAAVMVGSENGVATRLQNFVGDKKVFRIHCMAHRIELAMAEAIKSEDNTIDKVEACMRFIHRMHVKGGGTFTAYRQLGLSINLPMKVRRMRSLKGIRWRAIVGFGMETVVRDFRALKFWYEKNPVLLKGMNFLFGAEGLFWLHAANELLLDVGMLSKVLQNKEGRIFTIGARLNSFFETLTGFQSEFYMPDALTITEDNNLQVASPDDEHEDITISCSEQDFAAFVKARGEFINYTIKLRKIFEERFPVEQRAVLNSLAALDFKTWPIDSGRLDEFGNEAIRTLSDFTRLLIIVQDMFAEKAVAEWRSFKNWLSQLPARDYIVTADSLLLWQQFLSGHSDDANFPDCPAIGENLAKIVECVLLLPVSSAENERLAHALSLINSGASPKNADTASMRLFLQQNGPAWQQFDAKAYGTRWAGRHRRFILTVISDMVIDENVQEHTSDFSAMLSEEYSS